MVMTKKKRLKKWIKSAPIKTVTLYQQSQSKNGKSRTNDHPCLCLSYPAVYAMHSRHRHFHSTRFTILLVSQAQRYM